MTLPTNLGFPRIGPRRELKRALEAYWAGRASAAALDDAARARRAAAWRAQQGRGLMHVPSNDFSLYDQVLDAAVLTGAVPARFQALASDPRRLYFAMARGEKQDGIDVPALEMTKWFDTNYHYLVPELGDETVFALSSTKPLDELGEARALGVQTRPVLIGPVTFLLLSKSAKGSPLALLDRLLPVYEELLASLGEAGATWAELDEPGLVQGGTAETRAAYARAYDRLSRLARAPKLLVTTYFGALGDNLETAARLPVHGLHVDLVEAPEQLDAVLAALPQDRFLSAGVIDGRNVWRADLDAALATLRRIAGARGAERLMVAPSCSLLHCPLDLAAETRLDPELLGWLAFATDKLDEVVALATALDTGRADGEIFEKSRRARATREASTRVHDPSVAARLARISPAMLERKSPYPARRRAQQALGLPVLPTTTIGSFPQTPEVRAARAEHKAGTRSDESYEAFVRGEIQAAVRWQEEIGIDVLVHGEFERNDMVEYFGEQLSGFAFTENGWVQSYGSRCVKPPIIYGDVRRPRPMTVAWSAYAQSLTGRPMKAMLTGPVTIQKWSFVRADQPRDVTCRQIALAIRDEVLDLEAAGLRVIQIDEPAIREGLPLRRAGWAAYLGWAVECFRLASSGVGDGTQIHTHMCYSEFNDIIDSIAALDADVVSIETSRSRMELLDVFAGFRYPNEIGPGVYDIHSPRVPTEDEIVALLRRAAAVIDIRRLWVNPDCGLKTRRWAEVRPALEAMVRAARRVRAGLRADLLEERQRV